jgi:hypothetical protein
MISKTNYENKNNKNQQVHKSKQNKVENKPAYSLSSFSWDKETFVGVDLHVK